MDFTTFILFILLSSIHFYAYFILLVLTAFILKRQPITTRNNEGWDVLLKETSTHECTEQKRNLQSSKHYTIATHKAPTLNS